MNTYPPFMEGGRGFGPGYYHAGPPALAWATFALILLLTLAFFALLVARLASRRGHGPWRRQPGFAGPSPRQGADPLDILRIRYARGEIGRDEFLQGTGDLTAPGEGPPEQPPPS